MELYWVAACALDNMFTDTGTCKAPSGSGWYSARNTCFNDQIYRTYGSSAGGAV